MDFEPKYLVVTGGSCDERPGHDCVMWLYGPYTTIEGLEKMHLAGAVYKAEGFGVHYMYASPLMADA